MTWEHARYATTSALRAALEERLRRRAQDTGVPLDRLRKEVAHQRLLARLAVAAPPTSWALKGGLALIARLGDNARATRDADTSWRTQVDAVAEVIELAADTDLGDGFDFEVSAPRPLEAETDEGGLRYPVRALLDGREFERLQLDINVVPDDPRPIEQLRLRNLMGFAGIEAPQVPVVPPGQHLAEKLHAYTRKYAGGQSSRPRDLFDILVIARFIVIPPASVVQATCRQTFALRDTRWPPTLPAPPTTWTPQWSTYVADHGIPWTTLQQAYKALVPFWEPLLEGPGPGTWSWDADAWKWSQR